jgi:hypothetical protein
MARKLHSNLETRTARARLPVSSKPVFVTVAEGIGCGYRRNARGAGNWTARLADGKGGYALKNVGIADDYEDADGKDILDWWQAVDAARRLKRGESKTAIVTVKDAVESYKPRMASGEDNKSRLKKHVSPAFGRRPIALLTADDVSRWRDGLLKTIAPASANRVASILRSALNQRARGDATITNRDAWRDGLEAIPNAEQPRNVILPDAAVLRIVEEAYKHSDEFGRLVELAALSGARYDQLARIEVKDLRADSVMIPRSRKGKGEKSVTHYSVPLPAPLIDALRVAATGRAATDRLLLKPSGEPWAKSDHYRPFARAAERAGQDTAEVTIYALRHSSIVRQLLAAVPIRVVAVKHDTSVQMIERTYSAHIGDHADDMVRAVMLNTTRTPADVIPIRG